MNKLIEAFCLTLVLNFYAFPQTGANDECKKNEFIVDIRINKLISTIAVPSTVSRSLTRAISGRYRHLYNILTQNYF